MSHQLIGCIDAYNIIPRTPVMETQFQSVGVFSFHTSLHFHKQIQRS